MYRQLHTRTWAEDARNHQSASVAPLLMCFTPISPKIHRQGTYKLFCGSRNGLLEVQVQQIVGAFQVVGHLFLFGVA